MSTIYCNLLSKESSKKIIKKLKSFYKNSTFVKILNEDEVGDFNLVQNTNFCYIKLYKHSNSSKIIIVSLLDNLIKGASGQAVQCMNIMYDFQENTGLKNINSD